ncbi:MAG: Trk family potassium uptake protein [Clostridia bacterium]|nr:Trk family potassium uptake protein [Clostridia bacterium]
MQEVHKRLRLSHTQIIALGFFLLILTGSGLLLLPISHRPGTEVSFLDALFTATSATCVTGLIPVDTYCTWTLFGQAVLLVLIQIGGLGFMTIATGFLLLLRRRIGLLSRQILTESINRTHVGGVIRLAGRIFRVTALCEGLGAVLLSLRFVPQFGWARGIWFGIFHSVSAFCNAGFDLMGIREPYSSFVAYAGDPLVILTLSFLIITGGLGFMVWDDLARHRLDIRRWALHTRAVVFISALLLVGGTVFFLLSEGDASLAGKSGPDRLLSAFFASVTARTAGFNSVDVAAMSPAGKFMTVLLMFVGGSPGSTAGGAKTTTLLILLACSFSYMRNYRTNTVFGRRLPEDSLRKAASVFFTNLTLTVGATLLLCLLQPLPLLDSLFECTSAVGTVGMTTGITRELLPLSRVIVIFLMYCGRVGSLSFAAALAEKKAPPPITAPAGNIDIG